jgi:hypothetical protein
MKPDTEQLIHDLLDDESRRDAILVAGARILRRRRHWRVAWQTCALIMLVAATALLAKQDRQRPTLAQNSPPATQSAAPFHAQSLTDDQLLSLFPDTPVGLATLPNGRKLLIFPRAGDEAKFATRL